MKWLIAIFLLCFSCECDVACKYYKTLEEKWYAPDGRVKVLATTAMINDLVEQVGGEHVDSLILIRGELDPHTYQMVKGDDEKFSHADIIFYNGLGLEHGPSIQKQLHQNPHAVSLGDALLTDQPAILLEYNGQLDPHIWMDISLWSKTVPYIVTILSAKDPDHASEYRANGDRLMNQMAKAHEAVRAKLQRIPSDKRYLVTSHDAFNYFARAYLASDKEIEEGNWQDRFEAPEGLAPESQLSAADIQFIIDYMKKYHINVIFAESNVSRDSIRKIVQAGNEQGLDVTIATDYLYGDAMGPPESDGDSYLKMLWHNAATLSKYLYGEL